MPASTLPLYTGRYLYDRRYIAIGRAELSEVEYQFDGSAWIRDNFGSLKPQFEAPLVHVFRYRTQVPRFIYTAAPVHDLRDYILPLFTQHLERNKRNVLSGSAIGNAIQAVANASVPKDSIVQQMLSHAAGSSKGVSVAEVLVHKLSQKRFIPEDTPVRLHLALDCSQSMRKRGKLDYAVGAVNQLASSLRRMLRNTEVYGYVFSTRSSRVVLPIDRVTIPAEETIQSSRFQTVFKNRTGRAYQV